MGFNKSKLIVSVIIILLALLLFLPNTFDSIFSDEVEFLIAIILSSAIFVFMILEIYWDISKKQFTTTVYIVLADIMQIVAFTAVCYYSLKYYGVNNIELMLERNASLILATLFYLGASLMRSFFKSQKYLKKLDC